VSKKDRRRQLIAGHATRILKPKRIKTPWVWIVLTAFAVFFPMVMGYWLGEISLAIYGALVGYFLGLCDHEANKKQRLLVCFSAFFAAYIAFVLGVFSQSSDAGFILSSILVIYLLGLLGGKGAEIERLLLLAVINFFVATYARSLSVALLPKISFYMLLSLFAAILGIFCFPYANMERHKKIPSWKELFKLWSTKDISRHFYAFYITTAILLAILFVHFFQITRGYWTVITVLLVIKPNKRETIYRLIQRLFGSLIGVFVAEILIHLQLPLELLIFGATACAALVPACWNRNYWLVTFFATNLVILLLSMAQYGHIDQTLTFVRLVASLYGCGIGIFSVLLFRQLERHLFRNTS
jgi:hypothetical protein